MPFATSQSSVSKNYNEPDKSIGAGVRGECGECSKTTTVWGSANYEADHGRYCHDCWDSYLSKQKALPESEQFGISRNARRAKETVSDMTEKAKDYVADKWEDTKEVASKASKEVSKKAANAKDYVADKWEDTKEVAQNVAEKTKEKAVAAKDVVADKLGDAKSGANRAAKDAKAKGSELKQRVVRGATDAKKTVENAATAAKEKVEEFFDPDAEYSLTPQQKKRALIITLVSLFMILWIGTAAVAYKSTEAKSGAEKLYEIKDNLGKSLWTAGSTAGSNAWSAANTAGKYTWDAANTAGSYAWSAANTAGGVIGRGAVSAKDAATDAFSSMKKKLA